MQSKHFIWVKVFKNGPGRIYGRQPLKNFTWVILECLDPYVNFKRNGQINPFQHSFAFHIETSHLISSANQMTDFYMKCNTELKWVDIHFINPLSFPDPKL